jgi:hypothetical protein
LQIGCNRPDFDAQNGGQKLTKAKGSLGALKARLLDLDHLDERSRAFKTATGIKANVIADLGGPDNVSTLESLLAGHAGLSAAIVEHGYTAWLSGQQVSLTELATCQNAFLRICAALGVQRRAKDVTKSIESYLKDETKDD